MTLVTCLECRNFIPDKIGNGSGIGKCAEFEAYLLKNPSIKQQNDALIKLGNEPSKPYGRVFYGGSKGNRYRNCEKYERS